MRAIVMNGGDLTVETLPDPEPVAGQVLVAPLFTGICGSDLHARETLKGLKDMTPPDQQHMIPSLVPGHEFSAEVVAIGPGTETPLKAGARITPIPFTPSPAGYEVIGLSPAFSGGLSSLSLVDATRSYPIPADVPDDLAALTEPLAVGRHAANLARRNRGPNIIVGCGPVGLAVLLALKDQGRGPILAADFSPERRAVAEALGADFVVNPGQDSPYERWSDLAFSPAPPSPLLEPEFRGAAPGVNIFECVGAPGIIDQIMKQAPQHSHIIVVGVCAHEDKQTPQDGIVRELAMDYSFAYRPHEFEESLKMIAAKPDVISRLVTSRLTLAETPKAFDELSIRPTEIKVLIDPRS